MSEAALYHHLLQAFLVLPALVFPLLLLMSAPYGRHTRDGWGPQLDATQAWVVMESASPIVLAVCFLLGTERVGLPTLIFFVLWETHYIQRSFIFPFRRRGGARRMPLVIAANALIFNLLNGYLNGRWLYHFAPIYPVRWLADPRFLAGALLFATGFAINLHADAVLRNLRAPGDTGYRIPHGGLYRWISAPNYSIWTAANLAPRALSNHRWYREKFPDYPRDRKALIPKCL